MMTIRKADEIAADAWTCVGNVHVNYKADHLTAYHDHIM